MFLRRLLALSHRGREGLGSVDSGDGETGLSVGVFVRDEIPWGGKR